MLTTKQIRKHLATRTYAPAYWFEVYDGQFEGQHLTIGAELPDAYHPGQVTSVRVECFLPPIPDVDYLDRWMVWRLTRVASHEVREFWRDKATGRPVFDPHQEYAERDRPTEESAA